MIRQYDNCSSASGACPVRTLKVPCVLATSSCPKEGGPSNDGGGTLVRLHTTSLAVAVVGLVLVAGVCGCQSDRNRTDPDRDTFGPNVYEECDWTNLGIRRPIPTGFVFLRCGDFLLGSRRCGDCWRTNESCTMQERAEHYFVPCGLVVIDHRRDCETVVGTEPKVVSLQIRGETIFYHGVDRRGRAIQGSRSIACRSHSKRR